MKRLAIVFCLICLSGCTNAQMGKVKALGTSQHVTLYGATGQILREWDSTGTVHNEENSDGFYFVDKKSGNLIRVQGTVVVE